MLKTKTTTACSVKLALILAFFVQSNTAFMSKFSSICLTDSLLQKGAFFSTKSSCKSKCPKKLSLNAVNIPQMHENKNEIVDLEKDPFLVGSGIENNLNDRFLSRNEN